MFVDASSQQKHHGSPTGEDGVSVREDGDSGRKKLESRAKSGNEF